ALKVAVTAPPERGKANDAIARVLAETLGCKPAQVELLGGPTSRSKRFLVRGMELEEIRSRLTRGAAGSGE
ncbi:MAG TPA: DUF167 domain-containing protein, partial [Isosphaeraceae bacterium]|nr:DUF167 domain-containing protein [Isosphaeraceae bacterium]